jgi:signal transduction histidine kinase
MQDLSLHLLDIAENAIRAGGKKIVIEILEDESENKLTVSIEDDGKGMDKETIRNALDPFFTTKDCKKFGLGLSLLSQAAKQADGELKIDSKEDVGTKVTAIFKLDHPDMKPMGNIIETMTTLITANPKTQFIFNYKTGNESFYFDSFEKR